MFGDISLKIVAATFRINLAPCETLVSWYPRIRISIARFGVDESGLLLPLQKRDEHLPNPYIYLT